MSAMQRNWISPALADTMGTQHDSSVHYA